MSDESSPSRTTASNVLGGPLGVCGEEPMTGFYRNGCCQTGPGDHGVHVVCAVMTEEFLTYSVRQGNDLVTARPEVGFPGLNPGDRWCLCVTRWAQAHEDGMAPPIALQATHLSALEFVPLDVLRKYAID